MHPETLTVLDAWKRRPPLPALATKFDEIFEEIAQARHVYFGGDIVRAAHAFYRKGADADIYDVPAAARLPAAHVMANLAGMGGPAPGPLYLVRDTGGLGFDVMLCHAQEGPLDMGTVWPGEFVVVASRWGGDAFVKMALVLVGYCVALMAAPRLVACTDRTTPRPLRRRAPVRLPQQDWAWTEVTWTIDGRASAKGARAAAIPVAHRRPLHWCRGHWRRAARHHPAAQYLSDLPGRPPGFYTWIPGVWKGHPSYGVKLQRHCPTLGGEPSGSGGDGAGPARPASPVALAAMGAAYRGALAESGFAPAARLT